MRQSALAYYALEESRDLVVDDETDLLLDEDQEFCPVCDVELLDFEDDPFALYCPVCDRRYR